MGGIYPESLVHQRFPAENPMSEDILINVTPQETRVAVMQQGRVVDLDATLALRAASLGLEHKLPLADSIVYATARELGAVQVGLVAPYLAYMRQDIRFHEGEAVSSRSFARLLSHSLDFIVTVDPHLHRWHSLEQIYAIPAVAVAAAPVIAQWISQNVAKPFIVGPDAESAQWVAQVARLCGAPWTVLDKTRLGDSDVRVSLAAPAPPGGVKPVLLDDIVSTGRTLLAAAAMLALWVRGPAKPSAVVAAAPTAAASSAAAAWVRDSLIAVDSAATRIAWAPTADSTALGASGDVVWSTRAQRGVMRLIGLKSNDVKRWQYQLWIFDKTRDQRYPVDGGVFDVPAGSSLDAVAACPTNIASLSPDLQAKQLADQAAIDKAVAETPLGMLGDPEDIANAVADAMAVGLEYVESLQVGSTTSPELQAKFDAVNAAADLDPVGVARAVGHDAAALELNDAVGVAAGCRPVGDG